MMDVPNDDESNVLVHKMDATTKESENHKMILVDVYLLFLDGYDSVLVPENSEMESAVYEAMRKRNAYIPDWYITVGCKRMDRQDKIVRTCDILVHPRLRGGTGSGSSSTDGQGSSGTANEVPLKEYIKQLRRKKKFRWFEKVSIPECLRTAGQVLTFVVMLGSDARSVLVLLLECLERVHETCQCYNGKFTLDDILYLKEHGVFKISSRQVGITQNGYIADLLKVVEIIKQFFRYHARDGMHYPIYLYDLVHQICMIEKNPGYYLFKSQRSLIYNHPALMSSARRIKVFLLVILYAHSVDGADRTAFCSALKCDEFDNWRNDVTGPTAAPSMAAVYNHYFWDTNSKALVPKMYNSTILGKVDFCRCLVSHAINRGVSAKQVDAAMFLVWEAKLILTRIQKMLLVDYRPPSRQHQVHTGGSDSIYRADNQPEIIPEIGNFDMYEIFGLAAPLQN